MSKFLEEEDSRASDPVVPFIRLISDAPSRYRALRGTKGRLEMILHLALFRWHGDVVEGDIAKVTAALHEMAVSIPELRSYRCGANLRLRPSPADFGVAALVDDEEALAAYLDSPAHAEVYKHFLERMIAERSAVQLLVDTDATL